MIDDEIQTGIARTGRLLACDWEDVRPDVVVKWIYIIPTMHKCSWHSGKFAFAPGAPYYTTWHVLIGYFGSIQILGNCEDWLWSEFSFKDWSLSQTHIKWHIINNWSFSYLVSSHETQFRWTHSYAWKLSVSSGHNWY